MGRHEALGLVGKKLQGYHQHLNGGGKMSVSVKTLCH